MWIMSFGGCSLSEWWLVHYGVTHTNTLHQLLGVIVSGLWALSLQGCQIKPQNVLPERGETTEGATEVRQGGKGGDTV